MSKRPGGDPGYFGPESMVWRLHAHPSLMIGGLRTLLIQALNPRSMAGVDQHSDYRNDPWGRLQRTSDYLVTTTYGSTTEADKAAKKLRAIHKRIRGFDPVTGREYRADEPELLLWVHATEVDSFLTAYRTFGARLTDLEADRYVGEMVRAAELVGLPAAGTPATVGELEDYMSARGDLALTPAAREGMRVLLNPPMPLPLKPLWAQFAVAAVGLLPGKVRELYGLPWIPAVNPPLRLYMFTLMQIADAILPVHPQIRKALSQAKTTERTAA